MEIHELGTTGRIVHLPLKDFIQIRERERERGGGGRERERERERALVSLCVPVHTNILSFFVCKNRKVANLLV
jgi:hypothetical protein